MFYMTDLSQRAIKRILFECPDAIRVQFAVPDDLFEPDAANPDQLLTNPHWLTLSLSPKGSEYKRVVANVGGDLVAIGNAAISVSPVSTTLSFKIKVIGCSAMLYWIVMQLNDIALASFRPGGSRQPMRVRDYCGPEVVDVLTAAPGSEPFTERFGLIVPESVDVGAIAGLPGAEWLANGFGFEFRELVRR